MPVIQVSKLCNFSVGYKCWWKLMSSNDNKRQAQLTKPLKYTNYTLYALGFAWGKRTFIKQNGGHLNSVCMLICTTLHVLLWRPSRITVKLWNIRICMNAALCVAVLECVCVDVCVLLPPWSQSEQNPTVERHWSKGGQTGLLNCFQRHSD